MRSWMIAVVLGIAAVSIWPVLPSPQWLPVLIIPAVAALFLQRWFLFSLLVGLAIGWAGGLISLSQQLPSHLEDPDLIAQGRICSIPVHKNRYVSFDFCAVSLMSEGWEQQFGSVRLKLNWYEPDPPKLSPNTPLALRVRLKRLHGNLNPAGFDRETWLFANGYGATGYVRSLEATDLDLPWSLHGAIQQVRSQLLHKLRQAAEGLSHGPSLEALTLGVAENIQSYQWDQLARTGTTHLLVISGMHIGWFAALSFALVRLIWLKVPMAIAWSRAEVPAGLAALVGAAAYTGLSGMGIPAQRAFLMISAATFSVMLMRRWRASTVFCLALLGVMLVQPLATRSPGFWLSFGAVAAIGWGIAGRVRLPTSKVWQLWRIQWVVTLVLMPLLLFWFAQVSWVSLIVNLVAIPLITLWVTPAAMVGALLGFWPTGASLLFWVADIGLQLFWWMLEHSAKPAWAASNLQVPLWWIPLLFLLALLALLPRGTPVRWLVLVLALVWFYPPKPSSSETDLDFVLLDVGQGNASFFRQGTRVALYDTGPRYSETFDAGLAVVLPNLYRVGAQSLDRLVLSHGDSDHAGGYQSVAKAVPVAKALAGEPERSDPEGGLEQCLAEQVWSWPGVKFEVLWPVPPLRAGANNRSCVLKVEHGSWSLLLTGDIDAAVERLLVRRYGERLQADVLVLAHHGSRHSSSVVFLQAVKPRLALVSAGYRNRFRHPSKEVRARLEKLDIPLLNTADVGAISLKFRGERLIVDGERNRRWGYWYQRPEIELPIVLFAKNFTPEDVAKAPEPSTLSYRQ